MEINFFELPLIKLITIFLVLSFMTTKDWQVEKEKIWAITRSVLENDQLKNMRNGVKSRSYWKVFEKLLLNFVFFLKIVGLYSKGHAKALDLKINHFSLAYSELPEPFNNYKILHLSDLHLDSDMQLSNEISKKIKDLEYDVCVMTGDYRLAAYGGFKNVIKPMQNIMAHINAKDGIFATLGNHDTYLMVEEFEKLGIKFLHNDTRKIIKQGSQISITGTDDVHSYFTDQAVVELEKENHDFKIALVHSPELFDLAADNNYSLYLCGHTHGGQICLPNGKALIAHLYNGKDYVKGLWEYKKMIGYTSTGCGTSGIPVRINSESEITLFTLKKN